MDGLAFLPLSDSRVSSQIAGSPSLRRTIKSPISCVGTGVHGGGRVSVRLLPAPSGHGVAFRRSDLDLVFPARFDTVLDTRLCTVVGTAEGRVGTIEHLMAALAAAGIDDVLVEVDGPELPILDGSAEPWLFLLDCAGVAEHDVARGMIEVLRTVRASDGDAFAELRPSLDVAGLEMALAIDFEASAIGAQALSFTLGRDSFRGELARARTFAQKHEIEGLQRAGLARGGSLDNAVVVDGDAVLNPGGLRMSDEFVRHKMLDAVGDLALAGAPLVGRFVGRKSGHALNNRLLHALFADPANWRLMEPARALLAA